MTLQPLIVCGLQRRYGRRVALCEVNLEVRAAQIVGLAGPNGSGKTTLLKIIAGFLRPHAGSVRVWGHDPFTRQARVMERTRFAFAPPALFDALTPQEHLTHLVRIRGAQEAPPTRADIERVLELVGLADRARDRVATFSFGMRQRVLLALCLLPMPGLLVLDEPTDGLDPIGVLNLRRLLLRLREEHGVAILLSSHMLGEIEELVDDLLVLDGGRTLFQGAPRELTAGLARQRLAVSDNAAGRRLFEAAGYGVVELPGELELPRGTLDAQSAAELLGREGLRLLSFREYRPSLESALLDSLGAGSTRAQSALQP